MSKQAEFAVILKLNPMFADLGADELQRISGLCHTQQLGVGEVLFQKGDSGDALFGVRRGQIRIETGASDGSRLTLNFLGPGDLFGEVAVLDGQKPIRVAPEMVSRYPVSRSTRAWIADVMNPEGIPITSSSATMAITAATAAPAIFNALMAMFQTRQAATIPAVP